MQEFLKPHIVLGENNDVTLIDNQKNQGKDLKESITSSTEQNKYSADDSAVPFSQTSTLNDRLFEGNIIIIHILI